MNPHLPALSAGSVLMRNRSLAVLRWAAPALVLALMPKCPACLAAYLAIGTGMSVSLTVASSVGAMLTIACTSMLAALTVKWVCRRVRRPFHTATQAAQPDY